MIIRQTTDDGDWKFGKGLSDYARDEQAVEQNIKSRCLSWVGDCFFALQEGIDWRSRLDVGQKQALVEEIKGEILQSFGVVGITSIDFTFNPQLRDLRVVADAETIFSPSFQRAIQQAAGVS